MIPTCEHVHPRLIADLPRANLNKYHFEVDRSGPWVPPVCVGHLAIYVNTEIKDALLSVLPDSFMFSPVVYRNLYLHAFLGQGGPPRIAEMLDSGETCNYSTSEKLSHADMWSESWAMIPKSGFFLDSVSEDFDGYNFSRKTVMPDLVYPDDRWGFAESPPDAFFELYNMSYLYVSESMRSDLETVLGQWVVFNACDLRVR